MRTVDLTTYAITDPDRQVIYGVVAGTQSEHDALLAAMNRPQEVLFDAGRGARPIEAVPVDELADGRWREMAPVGATWQGQCGGYVQITEAWGRRFALVRADGTWAVVTYTWYGINESTGYVDEKTEAEVVEQRIEFLIVEDPHDLDYRHLWWADAFDKEYDPKPTEAGVLAHATEFTADYISWNGDED